MTIYKPALDVIEDVPLLPDELTITGYNLSLSQLAYYSATNKSFELDSNIDNDAFFNASIDCLAQHIDDGAKIYGVNTLFGGLANTKAQDVNELQAQLISSHLAGSGEPIAQNDVRCAMLIRVNSLAHGASGIRRELLQRYLDLANLNITPLVHQNGSIGASGDLLPLASIAGACIGLSDEYKLFYDGEYLPAKSVLRGLNLPPIALRPKEGLALINGTACLTAIAANNCISMRRLFNLYFQLQVAMCELLEADMRPFHPFVHRHRPHPGQIWVAEQLNRYLKDAKLTRSVEKVEADFERNELIQDRYSIRCIPQFTGTLVEDIWDVFKTVNIELNSATDNPLIDAANHDYYHGGNFLGQQVSMAMDKLRVSIALMAKHNEAQLATLVEPAFSGGLPASLVAPSSVGKSVGVKPLQILSNSLAPQIERNAAPLSVHFPVHAEQFNQNLNSQGYGASQLTRHSLDMFNQQLSAFWLSTVQALLLKADKLGTKANAVYSSSTNQLINRCLEQINFENDEPVSLINHETAVNVSSWLSKLNHYSLNNNIPGPLDFE